MSRPLVFTVLLLQLLSTATVQASNLRAESIVHDETLEHHDHERRRMQIAKFWTFEKMHSAIPLDMKVPKPSSTRKLHVTDDFDAPLPRHLENPDKFLIEFDDKMMECTVSHEPFPEDEQDRRLARPTDTHIFPPKNAVLDTKYIDFVVDVRDNDRDLVRILFFLRNMSSKRTKKTKFSPDKGNGRYTFRMGPFEDGDYQWAVRAIDSTKKKSKRKFDAFSVKLSGNANPTPSPPPDNIDDVSFQYYSPSRVTEDPVRFDWKASGNGIDLVYLHVTFPDRTKGYLTRVPTGNGRDSVQVMLDEAGEYEWFVSSTLSNGKTVDGPRQNFRIEGAPASPDCPQNLGRYTERDQDLHKAVGRIYFRYGNSFYLCSGTLVDGANDRALIATAAHCIYDTNSGTFPDFIMFIPGQDDGEGDGTDSNCMNDPHGCFYPSFGVISDRYRTSSFVQGFQYDYGFLVCPDTDPGNNSGPDQEEFGGDVYRSLVPMGIRFDGLAYNTNTHLFGYPGARDPHFMYTEGQTEQSPITNGGWYVACSELTGGASGGPWTQSDPSTGQMVVGSVNSWGWSDGSPGMGSPPFDVGAKCVYDAANAAALNSGDILASCPP